MRISAEIHKTKEEKGKNGNNTMAEYVMQECH